MICYRTFTLMLAPHRARLLLVKAQIECCSFSVSAETPFHAVERRYLLYGNTTKAVKDSDFACHTHRA